jgi:hypothetical protein
MNTRVLLAGVAALSVLSASAACAQSDEKKWEFNGHRCAIERYVKEGDGTLVQIQPEDIPDIEAGIKKLKACDRFYDCVVKRDWRRYTPTAKPKGTIPKHCYLPKELRGTSAE